VKNFRGQNFSDFSSPPPHTLQTGDKMKKNNRLALALCCGAMCLLLANAADVRDAAKEGLRLCAATVIPSMFPFLVISSLLTTLGLGDLLAAPLSGLMRLYGIDGCGSAALILGLLGGYPVGPRTALQLYRQKQLTEDEANRLLTFCNNANPIFFLTVLGLGCFHSVRTGIYLWLIQLLSALLTGFLLGRKKASFRREVHRAPAIRTSSFPAAFVEAVRSGTTGILTVCGFVLFFYAAVTPLRQLPGLAGTAALGCVELFSAVSRLPDTAAGFVTAAALSGWGGLCVQCQTLASLADSGLDGGKCVLGKAVQGVLSALLALLLIPRLFA
jgi:hypothetical protein